MKIVRWKQEIWGEQQKRAQGILDPKRFEDFVFFSYFLWKGGIEGTRLSLLIKMSTFDTYIKSGVNRRKSDSILLCFLIPFYRHIISMGGN